MVYHKINSCEKDFLRPESFQNRYLLILLIFYLIQHVISMIRVILANILDVKVSITYFLGIYFENGISQPSSGHLLF